MGEADTHGDSAVKGPEAGGGGHVTCWVPVGRGHLTCWVPLPCSA